MSLRLAWFWRVGTTISPAQGGLEAGIPYPVVASVMGWSAATAIRMAKRYHIGNQALRDATDVLERLQIPPGSLKKSPKSAEVGNVAVQ
jgi:hypothetical protein